MIYVVNAACVAVSSVCCVCRCLCDVCCVCMCLCVVSMLIGVCSE